MARVQVKELRSKSVKELNEVLVGLHKDQFNLRMQKNTGQLAQSHLISALKQDIARVKTLISEKAGS
jgi:large subunit ribosomal protein L29